jgi:hypothetical protein
MSASYVLRLLSREIAELLDFRALTEIKLRATDDICLLVASDHLAIQQFPRVCAIPNNAMA